MSLTYPKLRGRIIEKYGTCHRFAEVLGRPHCYVSRKLKLGTFSVAEIETWAKLLDIKPENIAYFFEIKV